MEVTPKRLARAATFDTPASSASRTATVFREYCSAWATVTWPRLPPPKFSGVQLPTRMKPSERVS